MPGPMTAAQLVQMTRDIIQHQQPNVYRNGFPDDADTDGTSILSWLNQSFNELLPTGFCKCWFNFNLVAGKSEYTLDEGAHEIQHCLIGGIPLLATTFLGLDATRPGWQNSPGIQYGLPTQYYTFSDQIGFNPYPDQAYPVYYLADAWPADLRIETDVPTRLPVRFHKTLAIRAAWWICQMDAENDVATKRVPGLQSVWEKDYADLQAVVNHRQSDLQEQINAGSYRHEFQYGSRY